MTAMTEPRNRKPKPAKGTKKPAAKPAKATAQTDWTVRLKALRDRLKLTQVEAAARIRVNQATWSGWENGRHEPDGPARYLIELLEAGTI